MRCLIFIFIVLISGSNLFGQNLVFEGQMSDFETKKKLADVQVKAFLNGNEVFSTTTSGNGKYTVTIPINQKYEIKYLKKGYVAKMMKIEATGINEEDLPIGGKIMPPVDIEIFEERPNANFSFLNKEPVVIWRYDKSKLLMDWDKSVYETTKAKIEKTLADADKNAQANEAKYNKLISEADADFAKENFENALSKYEEAIKIKGKEMENHPNMRILEISDILDAKRKESLLNAQADKKYNDLIEEAEALLKAEKYEQAIDKFYAAADEKPDENYPLDKVDEVRKVVKNLKKKEEYEALITMADQFYDQNSFQAARDKYQRALLLFPDKEHPKNRLKEMDAELEAEKSQQDKKKKYDEAIALADQFFDEENFEAAIEKYDEAYQIESASTYPVQRKELAQEKLAAIEKAKKDKENYDLAIKTADEALAAEDYDLAIKNYNSALGIYPDEKYPANKIDEIEKIVEQKSKELAQKNTIAEKLEKAAAELENENFQNAIEFYNQVLALEDNNETALNGKKNAENLLANAEKKAERNASFDKLISEADNFEKEGNLQSAVDKLTEANQLKPDEEGLSTRIDNLKQLIAEQSKNEETQNQIAELYVDAGKAMDDKDWNNAIDLFGKILNLDDKQDKAKTQLEIALAESDKQNNFLSLVEEGNQLFDAENYEEAKSKFNEALTITENKEVRDKIESINEAIELAKSNAKQKELLKEFNALIKTADELFSANDWSNAIDKYTEALTLVENDEHALEQIEKAKNQLKALEAKNQNNELFNEKLKAAQSAFEDEKYESAISLYDEALDLFPSDENALKGKELAEKSFVKNQEFEALVESAKNAEEDSKLEIALSNYQAAYALKEVSEIKNKIDALKKDLNEKLALEDSQASFDKFMLEAKLNKDAKDYDEALNKVNEALLIFPNDEEASDLKDEIQTLKEEIEGQLNAQKEFDKLLNLAQVALDAKEYEKAIKNAQKALDISDDNQTAKDVLENAKSQLDLQNELKSTYENLISYVNTLKSNGDFQDGLNLLVENEEFKDFDEQYGKLKGELEAEIKMLNEEKQNAEKMAQIKKEFDAIVEQADEAYDKGEFNEAIVLYNDAKVLIRDNKHVDERLKKAEEALALLAAQEKLDENFVKAISEADALFDAEKYNESAEIYKKAMDLKPNEIYATNRYKEATEQHEKQKENEKQQLFLSTVKEAKKHYEGDAFEKALLAFEEADNIVSGDEYVVQKIEELRNKLKEIAEELAKENQVLNAYNAAIEKADKLFEAQEYLKARDAYESALNVKKKDAYALKKRDESIEKAEQKARDEENAQYLKVVQTADELFFDENYNEAEELYKRANSLKPNDPYPSEQLDKIDRILNPVAYEELGLTDYGRAENISLIDGAALLEKAELERQNQKKQAVNNRLNKHKDKVVDLNLTDESERLVYQSEIDRVRNLRVNADFELNKSHQESNVYLSEQFYKMEQDRIQDLIFEKAENLRTYDQITFMNDEFQLLHLENQTKHLVNHEKSDEILIDFQKRKQQANSNMIEKLQSNNQSVVVIIDGVNNDMERAVEKRKANEKVVDEILKGEILARSQANETNYQKLQDLNKNADDASRRQLDDANEKAKVFDDINEQIVARKSTINDKKLNKNQQLVENSQALDQYLMKSNDDFKAAQREKDIYRLKNVEQLKIVQNDTELQEKARKFEDEQRLIKNNQEIQNTIVSIEKGRDVFKEGQLAMQSDLEDKQVKMKAEKQLKDAEKQDKLISNQNALDNAKVTDANIKSDKSVKPQDNHYAIDQKNTALRKQSEAEIKKKKEEQLAVQKMLDDLSNNKQKFNETVANKLGEAFPEGVSQETFIKKDNKGLPIQIITRRIVVENGRGEVYLRMQNRNLITYSKNGNAITEATWIKATERASLARHFE